MPLIFQTVCKQGGRPWLIFETHEVVTGEEGVPFCVDSCSVQLKASPSSLRANHRAPCLSVSGCGTASNTCFWHLINPPYAGATGNRVKGKEISRYLGGRSFE